MLWQALAVCVISMTRTSVSLVIAFRTPQPPRCKTITKPPIPPFHVKYPSSISFPRPFSEFHVQFQHPAHADDAAVLAAKKPAPEPDHVLSDGRFLRTFL